jgi:magnesium-transporting ATPase (P-type)
MVPREAGCRCCVSSALSTNTCFELIQDNSASLKGDIAMKATVIRDGVEDTILAREIVPGDIVVVEE